MPQPELSKVEELIEQLKVYVNTEIELGKLTATEKISKVSSNVIAAIFVGFVFMVFLLFASFSAAYFIGEAFHKLWLGFLLVAIFYLLLALIAWFAKEKLLRIPIMNAILSQLFPDKQDDQLA
jgi:hypothetical protein